MIKLGIIGTGGMANGHAQNFSGMKGVTLAACCDIDEKKGARVRRDVEDPPLVHGLRRDARPRKLDAVSNVTVDAMHAPISLAAIARGASRSVREAAGHHARGRAQDARRGARARSSRR